MPENRNISSYGVKAEADRQNAARNRITQEMVDVYGHAWGETPKGEPGDRTRAGLRAVMGGWVNPVHLMGIAEVATFFDVNPTTVSNWAYRRTSNHMPEPVAELRCGTIYDISQLLPWWIDWKPSKGSRAGTIDPYRILALGLEVTD